MDIYTDGGCHGNPGPGGWGYVICAPEGNIEGKGFDPFTTNNRMELLAVIEALTLVKTRNMNDGKLQVYTDSQYVQKGMSQWIAGWVRNGWKTASKQEVKNKDLWIRLLDLDKEFKPQWKWVLGHAGHPLNERCDSLAQEAMRSQSS